jgi:hypothetical protein
MNIKTENDFYYLDNIYTSPFFIVSYNFILDLEYSIVTLYMFKTHEEFLNNGVYTHSFGLDISNTIIDDETAVANIIIDFLKSVSPTTDFVIEYN